MQARGASEMDIDAAMGKMSVSGESLVEHTRKRSFVSAFLSEVAQECSPSKKRTRLELARAKNRKETHYQNMVKTKERATNIIERLREYEAAYEAENENCQRLTKLLNDDS